MPSDELIKEIKKEVLVDKRILGIHDFMMHNYGPGRVYVSLDAELPIDLTILQAHEIIDAAENRIKEKFSCEVSIHMDPTYNKDKETLRIKNILEVIVHGIDKEIKIHDFQLIHHEEGVNLSFDVEIPGESTLDPKELSLDIEKKLRDKGVNCGINITIDRCYIH